MMPTRRSRKDRTGIYSSGDWKPLSVIFLIVGVPTLGAIALMVLSSRPSLSDRTFSRLGDDKNVTVVDWPKLYRFSDGTAEGDRLLKRVSGSLVRVPGYMIWSERSRPHQGKTGEFLLVPDPGNWLHPPHLDSGEVVLVRMCGGLETPLLNRVPVWVQGRLSPRLVNKDNLEGAFELEATSVGQLSVRELKDPR